MSLSPLLSLIILATASPWIGIDLGVRTQPMEVDGQTFPCGVSVIGVAIHSPAAEADLRVGDVIVGINGEPLPGPAPQVRGQFTQRIAAKAIGEEITLMVFRDGVSRAATLDGDTTGDEGVWEDPLATITPRDLGSELTLAYTRTAELLEIPLRLAAPPTGITTYTLPTNTEIFDGAPPLADFASLCARLLKRYDATTDQAMLHKLFHGLVETGDSYRLARVAYVMRDPLAMPAVAERVADVPAALPAALQHAARQVDITLDTPAQVPLRGGFTPKQHGEQVSQYLSTAYRTYLKAISALTDEERAHLRDNADVITASLRNDIMVQRDTDKQRLAKLTRVVELSQRVNRAALTASAIQVAGLVDPAFLDILRADLADLTESVTVETPIGNIIIAGTDDDWHQEPATVIIDIGGDDFYTAETKPPFSIIIDLAGDDSYQATFDYAQSAAVLGVSLLYDAAGDDCYTAQQWSQAATINGVAMLHDAAGDDVYRGDRFSQAVAFNGIALLLDDAGDDRYEAPRFAQGLALPHGFAALVDRGGNDSYYCKGRDLGAYGTPGIFAGWGQGCALGFRGLASGGIGLLVDDGGDDRYEGGNFTQGGGYFYGWGLLIDRAGDDRYDGERYTQAFAAHQALGYLEDVAGNDRYAGRRNVEQSCAWDQSVTMLLDRAGDDEYSGGRGFSLAAAAHNGIAFLVDYAGRDRYANHRGQVRAKSNTYHGGSSFALHLDLGGADDAYADPNANNAVWHGPKHGFFVDTAASDPAGVQLPSAAKP